MPLFPTALCRVTRRCRIFEILAWKCQWLVLGAVACSGSKVGACAGRRSRNEAAKRRVSAFGPVPGWMTAAAQQAPVLRVFAFPTRVGRMEGLPVFD